MDKDNTIITKIRYGSEYTFVTTYQCCACKEVFNSILLDYFSYCPKCGKKIEGN